MKIIKSFTNLQNLIIMKFISLYVIKKPFLYSFIKNLKTEFILLAFAFQSSVALSMPHGDSDIVTHQSDESTLLFSPAIFTDKSGDPICQFNLRDFTSSAFDHENTGEELATAPFLESIDSDLMIVPLTEVFDPYGYSSLVSCESDQMASFSEQNWVQAGDLQMVVKGALLGSVLGSMCLYGIYVTAICIVSKIKKIRKK